MRDSLLLLAQASTGTEADAASGSTGDVPPPVVPHNWQEFLDTLNVVNDPDRLCAWLEQIPLIAAATTVTLGVLCVLNGYRWHKWVVAALAFLAGIAIGTTVSQTMGKSVVVATAMGCLFALVATPMLKLSVAILGGLVGAFVGTNAWNAIETSTTQTAEPQTHWAGAILGFIVIAMLSMILFRLVVVLFTSVGGAVMVVFGAIALLLEVQDWREPIQNSLVAQPLTVPMLVLLAAVGGFIVQQSALQASGVKILGSESSGST